MTLDAWFRPPQRILERPERSATWFFFATACLVYVPPLLWGKVLVGSTDNWFAIFPNHLVTAAELHRGGWGLWNPYILGGIDFAGSTHNFIYSPASWPLFWIPREWFQWGFHLRVLVETWLLGRFAYAFLREEFGSRSIALLAALTAQLGTNAFFAVTTYACLTLYVSLYGALAALWTLDRRPLWRNFLAVWIAVVLVLTSGNVVYAAGIVLILATLIVHRLRPSDVVRWHRDPVAWVALSAVTCAVLVSAIRLLPVAATLHDGDRVFTDSFHHAFGGHMNDPLLGVTALVPEALGTNIQTAKRLLQNYIWWEPVQHHQIDGYPYAGVVTILLVVVALLRPRRGRELFWPLFLVVTSLWFLSVRPFSDLIWTILFPYIHGIIPRLFVPVAVTGAFAWALRSILDTKGEPSPFVVPALAATVILAAGATAVPWFYLAPEWIRPTAVAVVIAVVASIAALAHAERVLKTLASPAIAPVALLVYGVVVALVSSFANWKDDLYVCSFVLIQTGMAALALIWLSTRRALDGRRLVARRLLVAALALVTLVMLIPLPEGSHPTTPNAGILALFGIVRLVLVAAIVGWLLGCLREGRIARDAFVAMIGFVLFADVVPVNREHQHVITEPFWRPEKIDRRHARNPALLPPAHDLARWRVNRPDVALGIDGSEFQSNIFSLYGLRSFGGVNSLRGARLSRLVSTFEPNPPFGPGAITPELHDPRLLDLLGAGFEGVTAGAVQRRPNALGRLLAFADYEVISDEEATLRRLGAGSFDPMRSVLLDHEPVGGALAERGRAIDLVFEEHTSDRIVASLEGAAPAIVFFGDVFDPGWRAWVDGVEHPVLHANHAFMAVSVPAGSTQLELHFAPPALLRGVRVAGVGMLATLAASGCFAFVDRRRGSGR